MSDLILAKYIGKNLERQSKKILRNGLIGVSVLARENCIKFMSIPPNCLGLPNKSFNTAVDAAKHYNLIVKKFFGKHAVTCDLNAAKELDAKYASRKKLP